MNQYDLVAQEDEWGCGVACMASLLGVSYQNAKKLAEDAKGLAINAEPGGLELHDIAIALQKAGVKVIADWDPADIPDGAIVCIRGKAPYADDHYILKTPSGWMDPWYNIGNNLREARSREEYPSGTYFLVALVPVNGQ